MPRDFSTDWRLICVNASGLIANRFGFRTPDLTVITMGGLRKGGPANVNMRRNLRGLRTDVALIRSSKSNFIKNYFLGYRSRWLLSKQEFKYEQCAIATPADSAKVVAAVLEEDAPVAHNISTGVFCILLAAHVGAKRIVIAGIDPSSTGHAYDQDMLKRQHSGEDRVVLSLLRRDPRFSFPVDA